LRHIPSSASNLRAAPSLQVWGR